MCGGDNGTRTRGLCVANASLYQLSHIPTAEIILAPKRRDVKRYCAVTVNFNGVREAGGVRG